jgi:hypothetical protein
VMERALNAASGHAELAEVAYRVGYHGVPGIGRAALAAGGSSPLQPLKQGALAKQLAMRMRHVWETLLPSQQILRRTEISGCRSCGEFYKSASSGCSHEASFSWKSGRLMPHPEPDSIEIPRFAWLESGKSLLLMISEKVGKLQCWEGKGILIQSI